jgi:hypothetical protein
VPVDAGNGGFPDPETTQDIVIAGSAAPGAEIAVYFATFTQQGWVGENVGFVNPVLYALGSSVFRDIVAEPGATDNSLNGVTDYPVVPGWDAGARRRASCCFEA